MDSDTAAAPALAASLGRRVEAEQLRAILTLIPASASATAAVATVIASVFWTQAPALPVLAALGLVYAAVLLLFLLHRRLRGRPLSTDNVDRWARANVRVMAFHGTAWGALTLAGFVPGSFVYQGFDITAMFAVCAATTIGVAPHFRSFVVFVVPAMTPIILRCLLERTADSVSLAVGGGIGLVYLLLAGRHASRLSAEAIRMRFDNAELLLQLQAQKQEAERARARAEAADRAKSRFLAAASHDLRQPVHALGLFVAAGRQASHEPDRARIARHVEASVESLTTLVDALLDVSRLEGNASAPELRPTRLRPLVERIAAEALPGALEKRLQLRVRCADWVVRTDALLLEQILRNLVANALRYTCAGGVLISARRRGETVCVEVWDTGIGIPEDRQALVFEEFYQVGNAQRDRRQGVGLGLAIVKHAAARLQHRLQLVSRPGAGSRFGIELPLERARPEVAAATAFEGACADDSLLFGMVIVVVDDEPDILAGVQLLLRQWGCVAVAATGLDAALDALAGLDRAPDAIVADFRLQGSATGLDVVHALRARCGAEMPALLLSGDDPAPWAAEAAASGVRLLRKPLQAEALKQALRHAFAPAEVSEGDAAAAA